MFNVQYIRAVTRIFILGVLFTLINFEQVFAEQNTIYNEQYNCSISLETSSTTYYFLSNINIDYLTIEYYNGEEVSKELQAKIIENLESENFDKILELIFRYNISLLTKEPIAVRDGQRGMPEQVYNFNRISGHTLRCLRGSTFILEMTITLSGTVIILSNGDVTTVGQPRLAREYRLPQQVNSAVDETLSASFSISQNRRSVSVLGSVRILGMGSQTAEFFASINHRLI